MVDQLVEKVIEHGGIWCCLCVYMIIYTNKKYNALETYVRNTLNETIKTNSDLLSKIEEKIDANKNGS